MPIYEYQCQGCGERQEELQGMNDPHLTECKACGGALKRLISSPAFQFKGTGWYATDYAKSGAAGADKGDSSSGDESGSSSSASKPSDSTKKTDSSKSSSKESSGTKAN